MIFLQVFLHVFKSWNAVHLDVLSVSIDNAFDEYVNFVAIKGLVSILNISQSLRPVDNKFLLGAEISIKFLILFGINIRECDWIFSEAFNYFLDIMYRPLVVCGSR